MNKWDDESHLEVIELLAEWEGFIASEEDLSEAFDEMLTEFGDPEKMTPTDIRCAFPDYVDGLSKDGTIHPLQAHNYGYVGQFDTD